MIPFHAKELSGLQAQIMGTLVLHVRERDFARRQNVLGPSVTGNTCQRQHGPQTDPHQCNCITKVDSHDNAPVEVSKEVPNLEEREMTNDR